MGPSLKAGLDLNQPARNEWVAPATAGASSNFSSVLRELMLSKSNGIAANSKSLI